MAVLGVYFTLSHCIYFFQQRWNLHCWFSFLHLVKLHAGWAGPVNTYLIYMGCTQTKMFWNQSGRAGVPGITCPGCFPRRPENPRVQNEATWSNQGYFGNLWSQVSICLSLCLYPWCSAEWALSKCSDRLRLVISGTQVSPATSQICISKFSYSFTTAETDKSFLSMQLLQAQIKYFFFS